MTETSKVSIRPAQLGDLVAIIDIYQASFARRSGTANFARDLKEIMLDSPYAMLYLVAVADGEVVGFVSAYPLDEVMDVYNLAVKPEVRRQGIGEKLLAGIRLAAVERGIDLIMLEVATSNQAALRLYEKAGFITYGIREGYYQQTGEDAYLMRLDLPETFDARLDLVPSEPGVYLMKEASGDIIYVGKANNLRQRLMSYFGRNPEGDARIRAMIARIADFEYLLCHNELEALILEANLIKKFKPRYNILLRDDREYPYIRITMQETYPRIMKSFRVEADLAEGARYFGPYLSGDLYRALAALRRIFPIKSCNRILPRDIGKERPCLNFYIGRCIGPCKGDVPATKYRAVIENVIRFFEGKYSELLLNLEQEMAAAAEALDFEQAALLRDRIDALAKLKDKQVIVSSDRQSRDVIGLARNGSEVCLQKLEVREGRVNSYVQTFTEDIGGSDPDYLQAFIAQHYAGTGLIPNEILLPADLSEQELVEQYLSELAGRKIVLHRPRRGDKNRLLELAAKNAAAALQRYTLMGGKSATGLELTLKKLAGLTGSERALHRIEAYDISNLGAADRAGSMVVFQRGRPERASYRHFSIASFDGIDDYSALYEVLSRRLDRLDDEEFGRRPDLILVDGGQTHVAKVKPLIPPDIALAGIVKDQRHRTRGLVLPGGEIIELREESDSEHLLIAEGEMDDARALRMGLLRLLTAIQDEAHRFARRLSGTKAKKRHLRLLLEDIPGVGPATRRKLLENFDGLAGIAAATLEQLQAVSGLPAKTAQAVYDYFHQTGDLS